MHPHDLRARNAIHWSERSCSWRQGISFWEGATMWGACGRACEANRSMMTSRRPVQPTLKRSQERELVVSSWCSRHRQLQKLLSRPSTDQAQL